MAASLLHSQKGEEFKEQFLTCPICYESYDNGEHQAKCLPCLHTFCLSCLKSHAGKRPKFNCPQCRKEIVLPGGSVDSLPNNFLVENLREYQDLINHAVLCGDCDDENQAVSFCQDCFLFLCQDCVDGHKKRRSQKHHKLLTMQELQQQKHPTRKEQVCQKHPTQILTLYCKEAACNVPVCASCGLLDHRSHELVDLTAAIDEIVAGIKQLSANVNSRNQELVKRKDAIATQQKQLVQRSEQKMNDIDKLEKKLVKLIESKCSEAKVHVKQLCGTEMKNLTTKIEAVDNITAQMTNASEFANKACDINHLTQTLTSQHQITDRLRELKNADLPETTSDRADFTFTDNHNHESALAQIQESAQHLCDISWLQRTGIGVDQKVSLREANFMRKKQSKNKSKIASAESKPQVDPKQCTIQMGLSNVYWRKAIVQTVDTDGRQMTTGGAKVEVTQDEFLGSFQVQDNKNGTYTFEYRIYWGKLHVKINDAPMRGSPFSA